VRWNYNKSASSETADDTEIVIEGAVSLRALSIIVSDTGTYDSVADRVLEFKDKTSGATIFEFFVPKWVSGDFEGVPINLEIPGLGFRFPGGLTVVPKLTSVTNLTILYQGGAAS